MMASNFKLEHLRAKGQEGEWPGSVNKEGGHLPYFQALCVCVGGRE